MVPTNLQVQLRALLATGVALSGRELQQALGVSQATLSRTLRQLQGDVAVLGRARQTQYALLREVRGLGCRFPLLRIDAEGVLHRVGELMALAGGRFAVSLEQGGFECYDGLPWYLWDLRPQGFLGRGFARRHGLDNLPARPQDWQDDDILQALVLRGGDMPGNLLVGDAALANWQAVLDVHVIMAEDAADRATGYGQRADRALHGTLVGSSAGGEQPKFAVTLRDADGCYREVLVKFSPLMGSASGRRWADLLVCEHLALEALREAGVCAAHSRLLESERRMFLEVERFDRVGESGRRGVVSLEAVDMEFLGEREGWERVAEQLWQRRQITASERRELIQRAAFGAWIANSDMHYGNVSFFLDDDWRLRLAPCYDMLPMALAPVAEQVLVRELPAPQSNGLTMEVWDWARTTARRYWAAVLNDARIAPAFKQALLEQAARLVAG